ncbi:MAG: SDR family oxidoreductase [Hyphomicrobiaceae bacterium]|nr:SDR family oxidoreductase [Hyphomicrobiaceae bacterium]
MPTKTILVAGATGLVGHAAMQHFAGLPDTRVIAVSRRKPAETFGARFIPVDLQDRARCAEIFGALPEVTHVVYAALYEKPGLVAGWREGDQIAVNDAMLRNLMDPLLGVAMGLCHVSLLQGTKAYGSHVRPMRYPAREGRDEARDVPNFYWQQEDYIRERQRGQPWAFTIFRPVLICGYSVGAAMNLIPAIGVYAAVLKERGEPLHYPGGPGRVSQAVDAGLLARAMAWAGDNDKARNEAFNVANGDVFSWPNVWPAIAAAVGMMPGEDRSMSLAAEIAPREDEWQRIVAKHGLAAPDLKSLVGLSFEYADWQMNFGRTKPAPVSFSSTIKLMQAGFTEVMDTETMLVDALREFQKRRLLPAPR